MEKVEKGIIFAGAGWMFAGILSVSVSIIQSYTSICNCPAIPVNSGQICACDGSTSLIYIGAIAIAAGILIIALRRRIIHLREMILSRR
jgi:hypothetical protein